MLKKFVISAAALFSFSEAAHAQTVNATDPASVVSALQNSGYRAELQKDSGGDPMIISSAEGSNYAILFYGCFKAELCRSLQFLARYENKSTLEVMNAWSQQKRYARGYISSDGSSALAFDLVLNDTFGNGGISKELFQTNLGIWTSTMASFEKHIGR